MDAVVPMVSVAVAVQLLPSVTVTVHAPAHKAVTEAVVDAEQPHE